jgi:hypothetical protein
VYDNNARQPDRLPLTLQASAARNVISRAYLDLEGYAVHCDW